MTFLREADPVRGVAQNVSPGVSRIVARNSGRMTYHGTNTYIIDDNDFGLSILDPGPNDAQHVDDILRACNGKAQRILISHAHGDHIGALPALRKATGAPVYASLHASSLMHDFELRNGDTVGGLTAIFTPGHSPDHLCFAWRNGIVFSGDHVMSWSSTVVSPPGGNMADYLQSLRLMLERCDSLYLCGHGPPLFNPIDHVQTLLQNRLRRESAILSYVRNNPADINEITTQVYGRIAENLQQAAQSNVHAHLLKLISDKQVTLDKNIWHAVI